MQWDLSDRVKTPAVSAESPPFVVPNLTTTNLAYLAGYLECIGVTEGSLFTDSVNGLDIRIGAIAELINHDAHHIMASGANDADLIRAVTAVDGLMSFERYVDICDQLKGLGPTLKETGAGKHAFMSLFLPWADGDSAYGDRFSDVEPTW